MPPPSLSTAQTPWRCRTPAPPFFGTHRCYGLEHLRGHPAIAGCGRRPCGPPGPCWLVPLRTDCCRRFPGPMEQWLTFDFILFFTSLGYACGVGLFPREGGKQCLGRGRWMAPGRWGWGETVTDPVSGVDVWWAPSLSPSRDTLERFPPENMKCDESACLGC